MATSAEYGLSNQKPMPWWVRKISALRRLWNNPVFQRNYQRSRVKKLAEPKPAFLVGLISSIVINTILLNLGRHYQFKSQEILMFSFAVTVGFPLACMYVLIYVRMFIVCLISTPIEMKKEIGPDIYNPVLCSPMRDSEIFFAECLPNYVRGLEVLVSYSAITLGLAIPCLIFGIPAFFSPDFNLAQFIAIVAIILADMALGIACLVLMMLLLSLASCTYTILLPSFSAIITTLIHFGIVSSMSNLAPNLIFGMYGGVFGLGLFSSMLFTSHYGSYVNFGPLYRDTYDVTEILLYILLALFCKVIITWFFCYLTSQWGLSAFSKMRRAGYYEPEYSTAAGLE
ncbi:MAG: hypothetical protein NTY09_15465 [bacterium]|nr:hypothetical protein [bacterium]